MNHSLIGTFLTRRFKDRVVLTRGGINIAEIDIPSKTRYKIAPHWHSRGCDPNDVVQQHVDYGYDAINSMREEFDDNENIIVIPGIENRAGSDTMKEHTLVLYDTNTRLYQAYQDVNAIMVRAHPNDPGRDFYTIEEMAQQFQSYRNMIGLEMFSRNSHPTQGFPDGDSVHPHRRGEGQYVRSSLIWDTLLMDYDLKIFGIGATDAYCDHDIVLGDTSFNTAWTELISEDSSEEKMKHCLINGHFFAISHMEQDKIPPKINNVDISESSINLTIDGEYTEIYWIYNHQLVGTGSTFSLLNWGENQKYVRYEVWTKPSGYWENDHEILEDPFESTFYEANIVIGQPIFKDDLPD